jgi:hypothetical protein
MMRIVRQAALFTLANIEIKELKIENIDDPALPLSISYQMNSPQFAQATGKRIIFHPNAFRSAQPALFKTSERRYAIQFPYAWKEIDVINIELPEGYALENAENPGSFKFGDAGGYSLSMAANANGAATELIVSRELVVGANGHMYFQAAEYPAIKKLFDNVQLRDTHNIALKEKGNFHDRMLSS